MTTQAAPRASAQAHPDLALRVENISKRYGASMHCGPSTWASAVAASTACSAKTVPARARWWHHLRPARSQRRPHFPERQEIQGADVKRMEAAGVFLVPQEPMIIEHMSVMENLMLGIWPASRGFIAWRRMRENATRMLAGTGIEADRLAVAWTLSPVASSISCGPCSPAAASSSWMSQQPRPLTVPDRLQLFDFMRQLRVRRDLSLHFPLQR
jgi:simple sugar transport system ATP-binding protein